MNLKNISLPDLGEGVTEGEILKIKVKEGESIVMDQILVEVMTDKASMEIPSSVEGLVQKIKVSEGDIAAVGAPLFLIQTEDKETPSGSDSPSETEKKPEEKPSPQEAQKKPEQKNIDWGGDSSGALAIPSTRKLAQDLGIDLKNSFKDQAKVTRGELLAHVRGRLQNAGQRSSAREPKNQPFREKKRVPLKGVSRLMFESMTLSNAAIPHFTIGEQAQVNHLMQLKTDMKSRLEKQGLKLGFLPFFIKALIPVIQEFPLFNAVYDSQTKDIVFKEDLNIGFAVDSPQGLLVPVIKEVQNKSLLEIIKEVFEKAQQARESSIQRKDLTGGGFTLTNLGSLGGMSGAPIIQAPEMAILGIYKIFQKIVQNNQGGFEEKNFMNFSITCDHRFIDGATAVRFLKSFIQKIEEPSLLLL